MMLINTLSYGHNQSFKSHGMRLPIFSWNRTRCHPTALWHLAGDVPNCAIEMLEQWWDDFVSTLQMVPHPSVPWDVPSGLESLVITYHTQKKKKKARITYKKCAKISHTTMMNGRSTETCILYCNKCRHNQHWEQIKLYQKQHAAKGRTKW